MLLLPCEVSQTTSFSARLSLENLTFSLQNKNIPINISEIKLIKNKTARGNCCKTFKNTILCLHSIYLIYAILNVFMYYSKQLKHTMYILYCNVLQNESSINWKQKVLFHIFMTLYYLLYFCSEAQDFWPKKHARGNDEKGQTAKKPKAFTIFFYNYLIRCITATHILKKTVKNLNQIYIILKPTWICC